MSDELELPIEAFPADLVAEREQRLIDAVRGLRKPAVTSDTIAVGGDVLEIKPFGGDNG